MNSYEQERGSRWHWRSAPPISAASPLRAWLTERGSMSRKLRSICREFRVIVHRNQWDDALPDERHLIGTAGNKRAWTREVSLVCDGHPLVFARTLVLARKQGTLIILFKNLGDRALGSLLFSRSDVERGVLLYTRLDRRNRLYRRCLDELRCPADDYFARRSIFASPDVRVCVTEVFSPLLSESASPVQPTHPAFDG